MKRISIVLLAILVFACLFVSCKNEPEPVHTHDHTYTNWAPSSDGSYHWRTTTCETHEVLREEDLHTVEEEDIKQLEELSAEGDTQLETTCVDCGYTLKSYKHRFSEEWSRDDNYHWHEVLCDHKDKVKYEVHAFVQKEVKESSTEGKDGVIVLECSVCKKTIEAVGHDFDEKQQCRICKGFKCGDNVVAVFYDATKTMTFKGKGLIYDFESNYRLENDKHEKVKNSMNLWGKKIHDRIEHVVFEDGVATTGEHILSYAENLADVKFGKDVVEIASFSFYHSSLSSVGFGSSQVKNIGSYAFCGTNVSTIELPSSLETMGSGCFQETKLSGKVELPEGLKYIGGDVFLCTSIEELSIPSTLSPWRSSGSGSSCLGNVKTLKSFTVAEGNPNMKASEDEKALVSLDGTTLIAVAAGAIDYVIPTGVEVVELHSFRGWTGTSIAVPEGVKTIEDSAFCSCSNLESVELPSSLMNISSNVFEYCRSLKKITINKPENSLKGYETYWMEDPYEDNEIEIIWNQP